ncbi:hypothetical protein Taro_037388 [Colocasia esculenta]|uniref:Uncharacterized protein n=1 Tax=Colocasia esculenta TaxID=4460 RepID=A0A843WAZ8_COLES|nr:hypothetical protein [Colocasia esculenta]
MQKLKPASGIFSLFNQRQGPEWYQSIEKCLAGADRQKQPGKIFVAHWVLGYANYQYVDITFFGHIQSYKRTCQLYENTCPTLEKSHFKGQMNRTIHVVAAQTRTSWSLCKDYNFGFMKLTMPGAVDNKKSSNSNVYDSFTITREYTNVVACVKDSSTAPNILAT